MGGLLSIPTHADILNDPHYTLTHVIQYDGKYHPIVVDSFESGGEWSMWQYAYAPHGWVKLRSEDVRGLVFEKRPAAKDMGLGLMPNRKVT